MLSVYHYICARKFLKDSWDHKKSKNPFFSMRSWASILGMTSNTTLSQMLSGKRKISKKYLHRFIESLDLNPQEGAHLELLIDLSREESAEGKKYYLDQIKEITTKNCIHIEEVDQFDQFSDPLSSIILEMSYLNGFQARAKWIR
jgi:uncharacterized protein (TIGR02147 family)